MKFILSVIIWITLLGTGGAIGAAVGGIGGLIIGVIVAQIIMATIIPGPKYPGDRNY
jgi:hypothetical protein